MREGSDQQGAESKLHSGESQWEGVGRVSIVRCRSDASTNSREFAAGGSVCGVFFKEGRPSALWIGNPFNPIHFWDRTLILSAPP